MDNLLDNWKSSQELAQVRRQRRSQICLGLSLSGSIFLFIFGMISIVEQHYILGGILLSAMCVALINAYILKVKDNLEQSVFIVNGTIFTLIATLLYSGGVDNSGILWIYPLLAINLFINRFSVAVVLSSIIITACAAVVFTPLLNLIPADYSQVVAFRFVLTLLALFAICLVALYSEEHAHGLVLKLHDNDIHKLAFYDSLTGLSNRWSFQQNLQTLIEKKKKKQSIALLYVDLDNFKFVNDNYGHDVGDKLLIHLAKLYNDYLRVSNISRLSGDEFVITLDKLETPQEAEFVAERILGFFEGGFDVDGIVYPVFASIGISIYSKELSTPSELLLAADAAMYTAKRKGNNSIQFFDENIAQQLLEKQNIETSLKAAIDSQEFTLVYQPIFSSNTRNVVAVEALLRCHNAGLEGYGPDKFIPAAESTGLIKELDEWVIDNAIKEFTLIRQSTGFEGQLSINISGLELLDDNFPNKINRIAARHDLASSYIDIEVTETALVPDNPIVIKVLNELASLGFSISLDDFGTGYTSFNQLVLYPAHNLKIDRSFTKDLFSTDASRSKVVQTIHDLAKIYELKVIAEGVDTQEQFDYLHHLGCDWLQGYFLSPPITKDEFIALLRKEYEAKATASSL